MTANEHACDFVYADTARDMENERDLCLLGQPGMATEKHRAQISIGQRWHELATGNHFLGSSEVIFSSYFDEGWQIE
jgi:hypothetical protein